MIIARREIRYILEISEDEAQIISALVSNTKAYGKPAILMQDIETELQRIGLVRLPQIVLINNVEYRILGTLSLINPEDD